MSTKQASIRATAGWRARIDSKPVPIYLHVNTLAKLDALVQARGGSGRGAVVAELIEAAHEALNAPARLVPEAPEVIDTR